MRRFRLPHLLWGENQRTGGPHLALIERNATPLKVTSRW